MVSAKTYLYRIKKQSLKIVFQLYDYFMDTDKYIRYTHYVNGFHNTNYHFDSTKISFIHIPKTGGTTFGKLLKKDPQLRFENLSIHRPVSLNCNPANYQYVTILRDPIDRVWSQYQHVLRGGKKYPYNKHAKQGLERFLKKCWVVQNLTCRYISGNVYEEPNEKTLENANTNLNLFYAVLSFKDFSKEVKIFLIQHQIVTDQIPNERKVNYSQPSESEIELIKKFNLLDIELFEKWKTYENKEVN